MYACTYVHIFLYIHMYICERERFIRLLVCRYRHRCTHNDDVYVDVGVAIHKVMAIDIDVI